MGVVIRLPDEVSSKIAAGEVIEGPSSVVRELLDNSLDAGSKHVRVAVRNGGKSFIQVADDGAGMSEEDALLAVETHTTSKIRDIGDLNSLASMGFRGEALASVCEVSEFTLLTARSGEVTGTRVTVSFGEGRRAEPAAANAGTVVTVGDLFENLPARRKFLKADRAEGARVKEEVLKKALSFHGVGFRLESDERTLLDLAPAPDALRRIAGIFGSSLEKNLIPIEHREALFSIRGYVSTRHATLSNRSGQYLFVNGRPVEDRSLLFAVNGPARGIVPSGRFVYAFVFIDVRADLVDVNVHPAKKEIRMKIEREVYGALHRAVARALETGFYGASSPVVRPTAYPSMFPARSAFSPQDSETEGRGSKVMEPREGGLGAALTGEHAPGVGEMARMERGAVQAEIPWEIPDPDGLSFKGVLFGTYCVFEGGDFVLLVDQHAAHERVLYEKYRGDALGGRSGPGPAVKGLLVPINVTPPRGRYGEILEAEHALREAGFEIEPFGDDSVNVLTVPAYIPDDFEEGAVAVLLEEVCRGPGVPDAGELRERFLEIAACRGAVKEGHRIGESGARRLLEDLRRTGVPYVCPHGRPTCLRAEKGGLDALFGRR